MLDEKERRRVIREAIRHYPEFEDYFIRSGSATITHKGLTIHFMDLRSWLHQLSPRKRQAVYYNVILDLKQKDVADIMGITTVSVGQYVDLATAQLEKMLFGEDGSV